VLVFRYEGTNIKILSDASRFNTSAVTALLRYVQRNR
jgi:hypothetical protein